MTDFLPVMATGSWAAYDSIGDRAIKHGDWIAVRWPDGSSEEFPVDVESSSRQYMDHGHEGTMPVTRAYYVHVYCGLSVKVPLLGLAARFLEAES